MNPTPWRYGSNYDQCDPGVYLVDAKNAIIVADTTEGTFSTETAELICSAVNTRDTIPAPQPERWPNLTAIGLGEAIDAIERVVTWAQQGKHKGQKWASQSEQHQQAKMLGHLSRAMRGDVIDEETGEHAYAHVAARALMLLGLALLEKENA